MASAEEKQKNPLPPELDESLATGLALIVRLAAENLRASHPDPLERARELALVSWAIAHASGPLAPNHREGLIDRTVHAACAEMAKESSLSFQASGHAALKTEVKKEMAAAVSHYGSEVDCWTDERRAALIDALSAVHWISTMNERSEAPSWSVDIVPELGGWAQWERKAAEIGRSSLAALAHQREARDELRASLALYSESLSDNSAPSMASAAKKLLRKLGGMGLAGLAVARSRDLASQIQKSADELVGNASHSHAFARAARRASALGVQALSLGTPEGDQAASRAGQALADAWADDLGLAKTAALSRAAEPWIGAALGGSMLAAEVASRLRRTWAGRVGGQGPADSEEALSARDALLTQASEAGMPFAGSGQLAHAWLRSPTGLALLEEQALCHEGRRHEAALERAFAAHGPQAEARLRAAAGMPPAPEDRELPLELCPEHCAGMIAAWCLGIAGRGHAGPPESGAQLATWVGVCQGSASAPAARSCLENAAVAAAARHDLAGARQAADAAIALGGKPPATAQAFAGGVNAELLLQLANRLAALPTQWGARCRDVSTWIREGVGEIVARAEAEAIGQSLAPAMPRVGARRM